MSWRVVAITSCAKLDYKMNYLVVRTADETKRISLTEISTLIIESTGVSFTAYLMSELLKRKINVIMCDEKRYPQGVLLPLSGCFDTSYKVRQQIAWKEDTKKSVWQEIVKKKICGQAAVLDSLNSEIKKRGNLLRSYISEVEPGDITNREGHAAKVYFNDLFDKDFSRDMECTENTALNYGYGILLSAFAREIACSGYITQIGIFHNNVHNSLNLACDLMEPFRPFVDKLVIDAKFEEFGHDEKVKVVQILNQIVSIENNNNYLINAIKIYSRSVLDSLSEDNVLLLKFPDYEL